MKLKDRIKQYSELILDDYAYLLGRQITRFSDKVIPGKRERRDRAIRNYVNKLLSGELDEEESFKLGFQASGVKSGYAGATGSLIAGCVTLNPVFFVLSGGFGSLALLHQDAMSKKIEKAAGKLTEEEREKLKKDLEDKDVYEIRDTLDQLFRF